MDLIVANYCTSGSGFGACTNESGKIGVLLGNGDGTFQTAVNYGSGGYLSYSVAVADVNGDGKPDLLVANEVSGCCDYGTVGVLLGNGDGTFQTAVTYASGGHAPFSVAVADVNGDGKPDLVVANRCASSSTCANGGTVSVLLGNGDGTFQTAVDYGSGGLQANSVAVADVNGDGKPDLVVANECLTFYGNTCRGNGVVGVLLGNGDGTFQTVVNYDSGQNLTQSVTVADVNGDGKPDLLLGNDERVGVLLGNGDGTFQTVVNYDSGGLAYSVAVADVNGDGKPDLVVANEQANTVGVLLGNGDGTFQTAVDYGSGGLQANSVAVADVNGDGKPDLLLANECSDSSCVNGSVGVLINTSLTGTTTAVTSSQNPSNFGQPVTFTATVTAQQGFYKGTPTGTVTFTYGSTTLCNAATLSGGTAVCAYSALPVGSDTVTAAYSGDANFAPGSGTLSQTVNKAATTTTVTSSLNPSTFDQQVTFTATVTGQFGGTPTGTVTFSDGSTTLGTSPLSAGMATFSTAVLAAGLHSINAVYSGDYNFLSGSASLSQIVNQASTTLTLTSSVNPSGFGQSVTFTALIATQYGGQASGTITFKDGSTTLGSSTVSSNAASLTTSGLAIGTHSITAIYSGNSNITGSTSPVLNQLVQGPSVKLSPASLTFPMQVVFTTSAAQTVTLSNTGHGILTVKTIAVSGQFAQTHTCGTTVNPGGSCTISVTFKPTTAGVQSGTLSITDNASGSPQKVSLKGTGIAITFSPANLTFTTELLGTSSAAKTVTLTNHGTATVSISGITTSGDYSKTTSCSTSLAAGATCTISVTFKPTAIGTITGLLAVQDADPTSPQKLSLTGVGTVVSLSPSSLTFASQLVGTISNSKPVTVTNHGSTALSISGISISGNFAQNHTCGSSLAAGASCTINVFFTPTAIGTRTGTLSVNDNGGGSPQKVTVSGTGTVVTLSPTSLSFGNQTVGTTSAAKTVTVTNHGSTTLGISGIAATGDFQEINACGTSLSAGASCQIKITFSPTVKGTRTGTLSVSDNGGGSPQKVSLTGTGT